MRKRLYFMLPDITSARQMLDEMLLLRIEERHIHFLAKRGTLPEDLPEASVLQKTDIVHGAEMGLVIGGVAGTLGGVLFFFLPPGGVSLQLVTILITAVFGALFTVDKPDAMSWRMLVGVSSIAFRVSCCVFRVSTSVRVLLCIALFVRSTAPRR